VLEKFSFIEISVFQIRIGTGFNQVSGVGSGFRRTKMTHKKNYVLKWLKAFPVA